VQRFPPERDRPFKVLTVDDERTDSQRHCSPEISGKLSGFAFSHSQGRLD